MLVSFLYTESSNRTGEIGKLLGAKWKEMDDDEKKPYVDQAAADKIRVETEKEQVEVSVSPVVSV